MLGYDPRNPIDNPALLRKHDADTGDRVVDTPFGKFLCNPQDLIESTTMAGTLWDGPGFLQVVAAQADVRGAVVLDVGANIGTFSIWCVAQGAARVIAVEPVPATLARLKANLDLNKAATADRVIPVPVAGYSHPCSLALGRVDPGNRGGTSLLPIPADAILVPLASPAVDLDHYRWLWDRLRLALIKIDAQGCDGAILKGLRQTLQQQHPLVVFEWDTALAEPHGVTLDWVRTYLAGLGYHLHRWPSHPDNYVAIYSGKAQP